ncbi:hypothetical protein NCLIV_029620 [Neospora caninum Liverpool]|uniref:Myosin J n=1 Tax=Neospora caninum (strain Liverpool) TaxID=572307 RepID=F0VHI0_NEOCL|nr:hypothetical protein NCLIV_029620 [Neospora caninum Liverpool]CBZ53174.1 hypothetical protein NCLIV_029620 [Neospora caninum Liverpool]|eukprot:XP_003883206.1 hypothetical protein NCLIV_029620 [Neospora caninum Liverpool]
MSLVCFKAHAYPAASALLRQPASLFSSPPPLLRLLSEVTRRRWRVAGLVISGRIHRVFLWLLRRVQLLRRLKEAAAQLAVRVILLKRVVLAPLRKKVQRRARVRRGFGELQRLLLRMGLSQWRQTCRRWAQAEASLASLAARRGLESEFRLRREASDGRRKLEEARKPSRSADIAVPDARSAGDRRLAQEAADLLRLSKETWKYAWKAELFNLTVPKTTKWDRQPFHSETMVLFSGVGLFLLELTLAESGLRDGPGWRLAEEETAAELVDVRCSRIPTGSGCSPSGNRGRVGPWLASAPGTAHHASPLQPALSCVGQHARYPELFVVSDSRARIFLLPVSVSSLSSLASPERGDIDQAFRQPEPDDAVSSLSPTSPLSGLFEGDRREGKIASLGVQGDEEGEPSLMLLMRPTGSAPSSLGLTLLSPSPSAGPARDTSPLALEEARARRKADRARLPDPPSSFCRPSRLAGREATRHLEPLGEGRTGIALPSLSGSSLPRCDPSSDSEDSSLPSLYRSSSLGSYSVASSAPDPSRGQPSTSLPALVPSAVSAPACIEAGAELSLNGARGLDSPLDGSVSRGLRMNNGACSPPSGPPLMNPYLSRFRRPSPLPPSIFSEAVLIGNRTEDAANHAPRVFFPSSGPVAPLLLPGGACHPSATPPGRWVPAELLHFAERQQEKLERHLSRSKGRTSRSKDTSNVEVSVRTLRVQFASPSTTHYVLILCHVSVVGGRSEGHVGGILALVLLNLLTRLPEAWVEIIPSEPDVGVLARKHKDALPDLLYTPAANPAFPEQTPAEENATAKSEGSERQAEDVMGGTAEGAAGAARAKRRPPQDSTPFCCSHPRIISTTILEPIEGGNKWLVAGPGVLAVVHVQLPHQLLGEEEVGDGGRDFEGETGTRKRTTKERGGVRERSDGRAGRESIKGLMEVLWNSKEIQAVANLFPPLSIADTWISGCMYTASPLSSLQDIGPHHPLFYFASAFSPSGSRFRSSLQEDVQHLVLLSTAEGELVLLRWLEKKQTLQLLERKPVQRSPQQYSVQKRFVRLSYNVADDDQQFVEQDGNSSLQTDDRCWTRLTAGRTVLRVTAPHPHLEKQRRDGDCGRRDDSTEPERGATRPPAGRGAKKVPVSTRWCEDVAAIRMSGRPLRLLAFSPLAGVQDTLALIVSASPKRLGLSSCKVFENSDCYFVDKRIHGKVPR